MPAVLSRTETDVDVLLTELGQRVRAWRARRGMTRKILASDSGLSERFLAQVESGQGNTSLTSLQAMADSLHIQLVDLLQEQTELSPAMARCTALLQLLNEEQLIEAANTLSKKFKLARSVGREKRIALIGLRGAGKSTLGKKLALARHVPFVELDREVEREAGASINEIFLLYGQAAYRRYEERALKRVAQEYLDGVVMTTGGSLVSERATYDALLSHFFTVWVKASPEEHMARVVAQGDLRPMQRTNGQEPSQEAMEDLRRILASRESLYARADAVVDTAHRSVAQSVNDLKKLVKA
jgi:XRE family transcriptional regulator, aerobic/anaerobic benzoate catabolism transcriptional regulator